MSTGDPLPSIEWNRVHIEVDANGRLRMRFPDGSVHESIIPVRAFPTSDREHYISFCDSNGHELFLLDALSNLDSEARHVVESELSRREFQPRISRIVEARPGSSQTDWVVETDKGQARFSTTTEESVRGRGTDEVVITDTRGIRYLIGSQKALDANSRRILKHFL